VAKNQLLVKEISSMTSNFLPDIPDSRSENFHGQLIEFGRFLERECLPGGRHDLKNWPNAVWQKIIEGMLHGLNEFMNYSSPEPLFLQWYNSGVFVKVAGKILAFDILPVPRFYNWPEPPDLTNKLAEIIDVLAITHAHADHFDEKLAARCSELGKSVLMPVGAIENFAGITCLGDRKVFDCGPLSLRAHRACHVWRDSPDDVAIAAFEVSAADNFRMVFCGDSDYTKDLPAITPQPDLMFITWRNPGPKYEDGHPAQQACTIDAVTLAITRFAPRQLVLEHYAELDHIYKGFSASYEIAIELIKNLQVPTSIHFWGDIFTL
jgi:hypothetical protein